MQRTTSCRNAFEYLCDLICPWQPKHSSNVWQSVYWKKNNRSAPKRWTWSVQVIFHWVRKWKDRAFIVLQHSILINLSNLQTAFKLAILHNPSVPNKIYNGMQMQNSEWMRSRTWKSQALTKSSIRALVGVAFSSAFAAIVRRVYLIICNQVCNRYFSTIRRVVSCIWRLFDAVARLRQVASLSVGVLFSLSFSHWLHRTIGANNTSQTMDVHECVTLKTFEIVSLAQSNLTSNEFPQFSSSIASAAR